MKTDTGGQALNRCRHCGERFPEHLIQPYITNNGNISVCGICALAISNEMHGMNRTEFGGEMANQYLVETKAYLAEKRRREDA